MFAETDADDYPKDYAVPNFGLDRDIQATHDHIGNAEIRLNHKLMFAENKDDEYPVDYGVPNFGLDKDIEASIKHMNDAHARLIKNWPQLVTLLLS